MADLFTHFVAARAPGIFVRDRRLQALLVIGTFLPDIAGKGLFLILQSRETSQMATHSIVGVLLLSYFACLFVDETLRRPGFLLLAAGGFIHVLVDLLKNNQGVGAAMLFLPFSVRGTEFSWIPPEDVVLLIPLDLAILTAAWLIERRLRRVQQ